jgi:hypothetical protein
MTRSILPAVLSVLVFTAGASAQCGARASARAVSLTWGDGPGDVSFDTGFVPSPRDAVAPAASWDRSIPRQAQGEMSVLVTAKAGLVRFEASGRAQTTSAGMVLSASGEGSFSDSLLVESDLLPPGAPVRARYTLTISGVPEVIDSQPQVSYIAWLGPCLSSGQSGPGSVSQTCDHVVGQSISFIGYFGVSLNAGSITGFGPINSSIAANLEARWTIEVLTPGARIVSCAGASYGDCPADFNGDGFLDFFDYDAFVGAFEAGVGLEADFNEDGFVDFFDYDAYVGAFEAGC